MEQMRRTELKVNKYIFGNFEKKMQKKMQKKTTPTACAAAA